jgi:hypothetical protein
LYDNNMDKTIEYEDHFNKEWYTVLYRAYLDKSIKLDLNCEKNFIAELLVGSNWTLKEVVDALIDSIHHKEKILSKDYTHIWIWHSKTSNNIVLTLIDSKYIL